MNLTRRQIALIVASIFVYKEELDKIDKSSVLTKKELDELIEILDEEYQTLIGE
jgi:hypothetical protein